MEGAVGGAPRSEDGGGAGGHAGQYGCSLCPRAFTTKRGISVHIHYANKKTGKVKPSDSDQESQPAKTKTTKRSRAEKAGSRDLQEGFEDQPVETEKSEPAQPHTGEDQQEEYKDQSARRKRRAADVKETQQQPEDVISQSEELSSSSSTSSGLSEIYRRNPAKYPKVRVARRASTKHRRAARLNLRLE